MKYHLGVDLGATNIAVGLVDENYNIIGRGTLPANPPRTAEQICNDIVMACHLAAGEAFVSFEDIVSIGIGAPGMCNHKSGELIFANNLGLQKLAHHGNDQVKKQNSKSLSHMSQNAGSSICRSSTP